MFFFLVCCWKNGARRFRKKTNKSIITCFGDVCITHKNYLERADWEPCLHLPRRDHVPQRQHSRYTTPERSRARRKKWQVGISGPDFCSRGYDDNMLLLDHAGRPHLLVRYLHTLYPVTAHITPNLQEESVWQSPLCGQSNRLQWLKYGLFSSRKGLECTKSVATLRFPPPRFFCFSGFFFLYYPPADG